MVPGKFCFRLIKEIPPLSYSKGTYVGNRKNLQSHITQGFPGGEGTGVDPITALSPHKNLQKTMGKTIAYCLTV